MGFEKLFEHHRILGKDVYVVKDHHKALAAWALARRSLDAAPNLITIDFHTDTMDAFETYAAIREQNGKGPREPLMQKLVADLDWRSDESVLKALRKLKHDEHITAATLSGILGYAFSFNLSNRDGTPSDQMRAYWDECDKLNRGDKRPARPVPPYTYSVPPTRAFDVPHYCAIGCNKTTHDDQCLIDHSLQIIDGPYLEDQLRRAAEMTRVTDLESPEARPYIFDIDLDAFRLTQAATPPDPSTLYRLIKNAEIVTIATEKECVRDGWLGDDRPNVKALLAQMFDHITRAMS